MKILGRNNFDDLLWYNMKIWCKKCFQENNKYDVVDNNMTKSFDTLILHARFKIIITMIEDIREK